MCCILTRMFICMVGSSVLCLQSEGFGRIWREVWSYEGSYGQGSVCFWNWPCLLVLHAVDCSLQWDMTMWGRQRSIRRKLTRLKALVENTAYRKIDRTRYG